MKTVILLRHADVDPTAGPAPDDHPLNAAGRARALALAHAVGPAGVATIYVSPGAANAGDGRPAGGRPRRRADADAFRPGRVRRAGHVRRHRPGDPGRGAQQHRPGTDRRARTTSPVQLVQGHDDLFVVALGTGPPGVLRLKYGAAPAPPAPTG